MPSLPSEAMTDVAIIGGGLAGSVAAIMLARQGLSITLVDLHGEPRPEFRAEQLVGPQIGRLAALGLLDAMTEKARLSTEVLNGRLGRMVDRTRVDQFGVPYEAMVRAVRATIPSSVEIVTGRVTGIRNSPEFQTVTLASGAEITSRLAVVATGLSSVLPKRLGIEYRTIRAGHSVALGFDVTPHAGTPDTFTPLVYYGENPRDRIDYLALFPMHGAIRANLFCYQEQNSEWIRAICREPKRELLRVIPGLSKLFGDFDAEPPVQVRSNDLRVANEPARDGFVLVGDAFQTPCPAAGTGIDRLLSDLDVLCTTHIPAWFASPGMPRAKIAAFYADPTKQSFDAECLRIAEYRRAVSTRENLWWTVHRKQVFFRRQLSNLLARRRPSKAAPPRTMAPMA